MLTPINNYHTIRKAFANMKINELFPLSKHLPYASIFFESPFKKFFVAKKIFFTYINSINVEKKEYVEIVL